MRRYRDEELDLETVLALKSRIEEDNEKYRVHVKMETGDFSALNFAGKLIYKNAVNYFIMSGKESTDLNKRLDSRWIGGTFSKKAVERKVPSQKGIGIIVAGVNAALLAPAAFGKQNFSISGKGRKVALK